MLFRHFARLVNLKMNLKQVTTFLDAISASLLNDSCDGDVEDETLSELVDNPETTIGTTLSVLQMRVSVIFAKLAYR